MQDEGQTEQSEDGLTIVDFIYYGHGISGNGMYCCSADAWRSVGTFGTVMVGRSTGSACHAESKQTPD